VRHAERPHGGEPSIISAFAMCGPNTRPVSTSLRWLIDSDIAERLNTCVMPFAMNGVSNPASGSRRRESSDHRVQPQHASLPMCTCMSVNPGMSHLPRPLIRRARAAAAHPRPIQSR